MNVCVSRFHFKSILITKLCIFNELTPACKYTAHIGNGNDEGITVLIPIDCCCCG